MFKCKHCKKEFDNLSTANKANHSRWCDKNPKRVEYTEKLISVRKQIKKPRNQFVKAKDEGRVLSSSMKGKPSTRKWYTHSPEIIEKIRQKALASTHRRLVRSIRPYTKIDGTIVMLDSSWEEVLAKRLDEIKIKWIRPETPIVYVTCDGKTHNYFPDFYLKDYDIFLDPKNPWAIKVQQEKLNILSIQLKNLKIISSLEECKNFTI